jgi:hypothetical protein
MPAFQGGGINGARRPPAGGAKLLGGAIPLKGVEAAEEPFEGLVRDCPFQTFKKRPSKKKEAASIEFEAVALEAKLLLQGLTVASICTEYIQNEDSLQLLCNRQLEGGDESRRRQKRGCGPEAFGKLAGKPGKSLPGEVFGAAMDSPAPASLPWINASTSAGFPQPDSKAAPRPLPPGKLQRAGTTPKCAGLNLQERQKRRSLYILFQKWSRIQRTQCRHIGIEDFDPARPKDHEYPSAFTASMSISKKFRPILCKAGRNRREIEKGGSTPRKTEAAMQRAHSAKPFAAKGRTVFPSKSDAPFASCSRAPAVFLKSLNCPKKRRFIAC